jgi:hypothetical protein
MFSRTIGLLVAIAVVADAHAMAHAAPGADLQSLAGPRGSRWGDSPEKVQRTEGRDAVEGITYGLACAVFRDVAIDGRTYEVIYRCFQRGGGLASIAGWRPTGKGITTAHITLQQFGPPRPVDDEFAWWERELTARYGAPTTSLDVAQSDDPALWPRWCPSALENQGAWMSGDCPMQDRFTKYRRWSGKKTVIELYDANRDGPRMRGDEHVHVVFAERSYFDAAEKAAARGVAAAIKKQQQQAASQKRVPSF